MERYKNRDTNKETIAVLLINQTYASFNSPGQIDSGGAKVSYYSSIIVQLSRKSDVHKVKNGVKMKVGIISRAKVKKNHLFDGQEAVSELEIVVSAEGIQLAKDVKGYKDIQGWDVNNEE